MYDYIDPDFELSKSIRNAYSTLGLCSLMYICTVVIHDMQHFGLTSNLQYTGRYNMQHWKWAYAHSYELVSTTRLTSRVLSDLELSYQRHIPRVIVTNRWEHDGVIIWGGEVPQKTSPPKHITAKPQRSSGLLSCRKGKIVHHAFKASARQEFSCIPN